MFRDGQLLEEEAFTLTGKDRPTLDGINQAGNNVFGMLFKQEYRKKEGSVAILSLAMANLGF